jgi:serpin B
MTIFLPRHRAGLPAFEKDFTLAKLDALRTQSPKDVRVWLPRFVIDAEYDLRTTLSAQGLALPFTPEAADFRGMADAKDVSIGAAVHKTFVEVTEKGTEAAVATAQLPEIKKTGDDAAVFRADHPFFFVIRDRKTGAIVFIGRVLRPL